MLSWKLMWLLDDCALPRNTAWQCSPYTHCNQDNSIIPLCLQEAISIFYPFLLLAMSTLITLWLALKLPSAVLIQLPSSGNLIMFIIGLITVCLLSPQMAPDPNSFPLETAAQRNLTSTSTHGSVWSLLKPHFLDVQVYMMPPIPHRSLL